MNNPPRPAVPGWLSGLLDLFYPTTIRCIACKNKLARDDERLLCAACADALVLIPAEAPCPRCGQPRAARGCLRCLSEQVEALDAVYAALFHEDSARGLVHALKYDGLREAARPLADGMAEALIASREEWDILAPIPLHRRKMRMRGFNQAMALAGELGALCGLPAREMLRRVSDTRQQASLNAAARHVNMRGAFSPITPMTGLRVLLVDDVCTTGATAENAARACKAAGAARVGLITATRAE